MQIRRGNPDVSAQGLAWLLAQSSGPLQLRGARDRARRTTSQETRFYSISNTYDIHILVSEIASLR